MNTPVNSPQCLNCAETLQPRAGGEHPVFCPACGQETNVKPPKLGEFLQQFGGAYFSTEGALWRTLKLLLFRPGELTRLYLAGRRKHYVLPLRLYLTISLIVLLLLRVAGGASVQMDAGEQTPDAQARATVDKDAIRKTNISILGDGDMGFGLKDGVFFCRQLPEWLCKRAKKRIDIDPQAVAGELERFKDRVIGNAGAAMFLLLPTYALWMKLAYWNRRLRYTEHLVFALHVHAFWFLAFALALFDVWWLTALAGTAVPVYTLWATKRVYGGALSWRLLRAALVSMLYLVMMALAIVGVALWAILA